MHAATKLLIVLASLSGQLAQAGQHPSFDVAAAPVSAGEVRDRDRFYAEPGTGTTGTHIDDPAARRASSERKTAFKVHPLVTLGGMVLSLSTNTGAFLLPLELEHAPTPSFSLYAMASPVFLTAGLQSAAGVALNGGVRAYLTGTAPDGFWIGGQLGATLLMSETASSASFDLQPQIGYQWVFENGFTLGLGGGISLASIGSGQPQLTFLLPLGYAW